MNSKSPKGPVMAVLGMFDGNLVACSGEIKLTENGLAMKNAGEVLYVRNWVVITDGVVVKSVA